MEEISKEETSYDELERVAKAVYESHRNHSISKLGISPDRAIPWENSPDDVREHWLEVASDALVETRDVKSPLNKLRVSLARIAQKLDLDVPGCADEADFTAISKAAETKERGWNGLAASILDAIELLHKEVQSQRRVNVTLDSENATLQRKNRTLCEEIVELEYELRGDACY